MSSVNQPLLPVYGQGRGGLWAFITSPLTRLWQIYVDAQDPKWAFIKNIFLIVFLQLLMAATVATSILHDESAAKFFKSTWIGLMVYIVIVLFVPAALILLYYNKKSVILLIIFILALGSALGLVGVFTDVANVIQQSLIITTVAFAGLVAYAFFASFIPMMCNMIIAFIWGAVLIIGLFIFTQKCAHRIWSWLLLGGLSLNQATVGAVIALLFSGYVAWDTTSLVGEQTSIWASMRLYLDVFLRLWPVVKFILDLVKQGIKK